MYAKDFLTNVGKLKSKDSRTILNDATKGTIVGATIGAGIGLYIGLSRKKNFFSGTDKR
jgi:hypothetical protein